VVDQYLKILLRIGERAEVGKTPSRTPKLDDPAPEQQSLFLEEFEFLRVSAYWERVRTAEQE
jgi:hypothetical protein